MLSYTRGGAGSPLVLIHGLGASRRIWDPVLDHLSRERDVIAPDLPGFGDSPPLPAGVSPTASALGHSVLELLRILGVPRFHVAGNSLGGWVALELGRSHAVSVAAISPAGLWSKPLGPRPFDVQRAARLARPLIDLALRTRSGRSALLRSAVGHPDRVPAGAARALLRDWLGAPSYSAANREMRASVLERPEEITVPVTIIRGERDHLVGPPNPAQLPPNATYVSIEDAGHTPTWDDPELIAELLLGASEPSATLGDARSRP